MRRRWTATVLILGVGMIALTILQCQTGDRIPPKGSTIVVSGNPTTIPLGNSPACTSILQVSSCGTSEITAAVSSDLGVPLPDQDVRFSSTAGKLFIGSLSAPIPIGNVPVQTDSAGNARVNLVTSTTSTVTARSGLASGPLTLSTVQGNLSLITLNADPNDPTCNDTTITSCGQSVCLVATAQDSSSTGIQGVAILFTLVNNVSGSNTFRGQFVPSQKTTDVNGEATTLFTPDSTCTAQCGGGKSCQGEIVATTQGGSFPSAPVQLLINIP